MYVQWNSTLKIEGKLAICNDVNEPGGHYAQWIKPERGRQILYATTYMWNLRKKKKFELGYRE